MTRRNHPPLQTPLTLRQLVLALLASALLAGLLIGTATFAAVHVLQDRSVLGAAAPNHLALGPAGETETDPQLAEQAARDRLAADRQAESVRRLSMDKRWEDPSQHEALTRAMQDSVRAMERHRADASRLETRLRPVIR